MLKTNTTNRPAAYRALVEKRQKRQFADGLVNPSQTGFDVYEPTPRAQWHDKLDACILVVGQEP